MKIENHFGIIETAVYPRKNLFRFVVLYFRACFLICRVFRWRIFFVLLYFMSVLACLSVVLLDSLIGLVVKATASRAEDSGLESRLRRDFSWVESYQ